MSQQEKTLTAAQKQLSHTPLFHLYVTSLTPLPTTFLFILQTGNGEGRHRNHRGLLLSLSAHTDMLLTLMIHPASDTGNQNYIINLNFKDTDLIPPFLYSESDRSEPGRYRNTRNELSVVIILL